MICLEMSTGKRKILALVSFHSDIYARILRPFTFPRSMRQYAHERQTSEDYKQSIVSRKNKAVSRKNTRERKSGRFRKRFSAKLRFALVFRSAFLVCVTACAWLRRREAPTHLSMTSTRHGAKLPNQLF